MNFFKLSSTAYKRNQPIRWSDFRDEKMFYSLSSDKTVIPLVMLHRYLLKNVAHYWKSGKGYMAKHPEKNIMTFF